MRLLLIEDDQRVASALNDALGSHGFAVRRATNTQQALELVADDIEIALLDLGLPDGDGFDLCRQIRAAHDFPIIMTTARADLRSRVHGLQVGADDYLVKPYAFAELIARIHALLRRVRRTEQTPAPDDGSGVIECRGVSIDLTRRTVHSADREVRLTRKEFDLLAAIARCSGLVVRREQLLSEVWRTLRTGGQHTLDVHVASVRSKCGEPKLIETVRGVGYKLGVEQ